MFANGKLDKRKRAEDAAREKGGVGRGSRRTRPRAKRKGGRREKNFGSPTIEGTAADEEDGSDYNNDEPDNYEDEGTGEEEEESSPAPPPNFFSSPVNYTMRPGDDVMFPCQVDSIGKMVQMWLNGSQTITVKDSILGDKERVSRFPNMTLLIKNVRPEDSGTYTCQIVSQPLANLTHYLKVPAPAKILSHSQKQSVTLGQSLTLTCNVWGYPQPIVKWTLQGREVPDATFNEDGSVLTVKSVTKHHEGHYKCIADNHVGRPVDATIIVNVANRPQVTAQKSKINSGEGETVDLACTVSGQPKPMLKWYKDGQEMEIGTSRFPDIPKYRGSEVEDDKVILKWDVESSVPIEKHELRYRKQGVEDWEVANPMVKDPQGNIYSVEYALENLSAGNYEVVFRSKNEYGWGEQSELEHFKQSEKLNNHEEESPSIEEKPAAETSKRGPDGSASSICTLSSLTSAFLAISITNEYQLTPRVS
ncbi:Interference hedgehog [Gryllus bimaculatus]|nr:Interference hedgehog [Gryllus bimaculatus]